MKKRRKATDTAWAVWIRYSDNETMAGRYWFQHPQYKDRSFTVPPVTPCPIALFKSRREAREAAKATDGRHREDWPWPVATAVRVVVSVQILPRPRRKEKLSEPLEPPRGE